MSERNPRVIRSQMGDLEAAADPSEGERRLQAEEVERWERAARQAHHDEGRDDGEDDDEP